jgi:hypothetical protein
VHVSIDHNLEQPTAAEAAREEEEFGLNTPAPSKGEDDTCSTSGNEGGSSGTSSNGSNGSSRPDEST